MRLKLFIRYLHSSLSERVGLNWNLIQVHETIHTVSSLSERVGLNWNLIQVFETIQSIHTVSSLSVSSVNAESSLQV